MPRELRIFSAGASYHITCRTARGELVFDEPAETERWIDTVAFVADQERLRILAWCLLSNHYHLVVRTEGGPLCRPMARIQGRFARDFKRRRRRMGRLWQSRYRARMVVDPSSLRHLAASLDASSVSVGRWLSEGLQLQTLDPEFRSRLQDLVGDIEGRATRLQPRWRPGVVRVELMAATQVAGDVANDEARGAQPVYTNVDTYSWVMYLDD